MPKQESQTTVDMTVSQVARELHIRRDTVVMFLRSGKLQGYDVTAPDAKRKSYRITRKAVDAFKAAQTVQPQSMLVRRTAATPTPQNVTEFF